MIEPPVHPSVARYGRHFAPAAPSDSGARVFATFLGTNGLLLEDGETRLFLDPNFTRPGKFRTLFLPIAPDEGIVSRTLKDLEVDRADAVLVTHSHFDHLLDAPMVALKTGAKLMGSRSTLRAGQGQGMAEDQMKLATTGESFFVGDFRILFKKDRHLPFPRFMRPFAGIGQAIKKPLTMPARFTEFKEGGCFTIQITHPAGRILALGSANFVPGALEGESADAMFISMGGLDLTSPGFMPELYRETVARVQPKTLYLTHWDDFTLPLTAPARWVGKCHKAVDFFLSKRTPEMNVLVFPIGRKAELF